MPPSRFEPTGDSDIFEELLAAEPDAFADELPDPFADRQAAKQTGKMPPRLERREDGEDADATADAERIEQAISNHCYQTYEDSRGAIGEEIDRKSVV